MLAPAPSRHDRRAMHNANKLKIGLFGANCSSGRAVTTVPERWSGSWPDNLRLAQMADEAGIDFLLPIGRWKGYGGDTDYQGATLETVTWATGLLALTKRITVFGTVHAPLFNPVMAAKQMVTADHIGEGRFGLNVVVGWNEGEFEMFGVRQRDHEARYDYAQEWIDVDQDDLVGPRRTSISTGKYLNIKGIRGKPKPYGGARPVIMNAGASPVGRAFAIRNCDAFFLRPRVRRSIETAQRLRPQRARPSEQVGSSASTRSASSPAGRPKRRPRTITITRIVENADWTAVDEILGAQEHHRRDHAGREVPADRRQLGQRHGRPADRRRSRPCGRQSSSSQGRIARHRGLARQLCRRTPLLLRRGPAAARARRPARDPSLMIARAD